MNFTLTITLSAELLVLAQAFLAGFTTGKPASIPAGPAGKKITEVSAASDFTDEGASASGITLEELRAVVEPLIQTNRAQVKALLTSFGAKGISSLDASHYEAFLEKVQAL